VRSASFGTLIQGSVYAKTATDNLPFNDDFFRRIIGLVIEGTSESEDRDSD